MTLPQGVAIILQSIPVGAVVLVGGAAFKLIERFTSDPIMRERVNAGSDKFFEDERRAMGEMLPELEDEVPWE